MSTMCGRMSSCARVANPRRQRAFFILILLTRLAFADAGLLLPGDKKQPDPAWLSLEEMTIDIHIDNGHARVSTRQILRTTRTPPSKELTSSPCLAAPSSPISPSGTMRRVFQA